MKLSLKCEYIIGKNYSKHSEQNFIKKNIALIVSYLEIYMYICTSK
ncbi:hypothetical protein C8D70_12110 [Chryseobacterium sp. CBTAP 102]|nr:hypothetical protein C8D70_12110 [Chryseobacterium sp. CBTAP 102]SIR67172.1 hypothetical protein SAMN05880573_13311 [Chryseobacterium sp. RU33C]